MSDLPQFDAKENYYKVLGIEPSNSPDDNVDAAIKQAYRKLALKNHPDIVGSSVKSLHDFNAIQRAYDILSDPTTRQHYDRERGGLGLGPLVSGRNFDRIGQDNVGINFNTQRQNYQTTVRYQASSSWRELKTKYKTEKWQNLPLSERKNFRARPVRGAGAHVDA